MWVAIYSPSIGGGTAAAAIALCAAFCLLIWNDVAIGVLINRHTWATDKSSLDERRFKLSETVDVVWKEAMKAYVVYMQPCTADATAWREIVAAICTHDLRRGHYIFKSLIPEERAYGPPLRHLPE
ncbi:hypothetical protein MVEN_00025300 [Mycena venus]|uniref:Uncharacterized protein n=1 Tax=Mycena venus TaxID=2733690 RepID=A0A8H6Z9K5_9AGAR|nr:hypothetical protein MVEN_00025300 [Mycena venus]